MIVVIIMALVIIGLLGFVFYQNFIQKKTVEGTDTTTSKASTSTPAATTPPAINSDPTAGWKTYSDTTIVHASFKYPSDWTLTSGVNSVDIKSPDFNAERDYTGISSGSVLSIVFGDKKQNPYPSSLDEEVTSNSGTAKQNITLGGVSAVEYKYPTEEEQNNGLAVYAVYNGNTYGMYQMYKLNSDNPYTSLVDNIVGSFKFNK